MSCHATCCLNVVLFLVLGLAGCTWMNTTSPDRTAFDPAEYVPYERIGTATIRGQVFRTTGSGATRYGSGQVVWLIPQTTYSSARFTGTLSKPRIDDLGTDSPAAKYTKSTNADAAGRFRFDYVPAGRYYLVSRWGEVIVYTAVEVTAGQTVTGDLGR